MGIEHNEQDKSAIDSMNLRDFRNDPSTLMDTDDTQSLESSDYHQEINTLKIEKLSNRITIISVIIPCLIIAVLIFAYLDIKERVVDVDVTKKLQVEKIAQQLEEKLNALDLRIAKNKFNMDQQLPVLAKKEQALENQVAKMSVSKADEKTIKASIKTSLTALDKKIKKNAGQSKSNLLAMEAINVKLLASITKNNIQLKEEEAQIKEEINLFKEEFDARLLELSAYEEQIGQLRKTTSLLDKKLKSMDLEGISGKELDKRFKLIQQSLEKKIQALETKSEQPTPGQSPSVNKTENSQIKKKSLDAKPVPQLDTGDIKSESISEETLTQ